jgi:glyoxylase-like metal-dependent hydrolase (beta-lactamase superfamily II)
MDGLRAVNVYVIETAGGLTLIDGGWAIREAREVLDRSLRELGAAMRDIRRFLVTHVHRDHYTLAVVLGAELGAEVSLGMGDRSTLDVIHQGSGADREWTRQILRSAGAEELAERWDGEPPLELEPEWWRYPDRWLEFDHTIEVGDRSVEAVHTPGHTPGHFVFADVEAGLLFAGDHVLPTITPSIGYVSPPPPDPLGDFMASLTRVRELPDLRVLPAHGPVAESSHRRVDELLAHIEDRLRLAGEAVVAGCTSAFEVAAALPWTRRERSLRELDLFNQTLATRETLAHLEVLVSRGAVTRAEEADGRQAFSSPLFPRMP